MAPPKSRPWKAENKKLTQTATFLRLRIAAGLLNANNAVKAQQIICFAAHFRLLRGRQGSAIAKKLQKEQNYCFHNRQIAVTGARSHEKRVNSPSEGKGQTLQKKQEGKPHKTTRASQVSRTDSAKGVAAASNDNGTALCKNHTARQQQSGKSHEREL